MVLIEGQSIHCPPLFSGQLNDHFSTESWSALTASSLLDMHKTLHQGRVHSNQMPKPPQQTDKAWQEYFNSFTWGSNSFKTLRGHSTLVTKDHIVRGSDSDPRPCKLFQWELMVSGWRSQQDPIIFKKQRGDPMAAQSRSLPPLDGTDKFNLHWKWVQLTASNIVHTWLYLKHVLAACEHNF